MKRHVLLSFVLVLSLCAIIVGMSDDSYAPESGDSTEDTTVPVERVSVSPSSMNMLPEDVETLRATVYPSNATNSSVSWSCYPTGIVSLNSSGNSCTVTALKAGTVTVTASSSDGQRGSCTITVTAVTISIDKDDLVLIQGDYERVNVTVTPSSVSNEVSVSYSTNSVVTWDTYSDELYASREGTTTVTFEVRGAEAECTVEVLGGHIEAYDTRIDVTINTKDGVGLAGEVTRYNNDLQGTLIASVSSAGMSNGSMTSAAATYLQKCLEAVDYKASWAPIRVEVDGGDATTLSVSSVAMGALSNAGASLDISSSNGGVLLDPNSVKGLTGSNWSFSLVEVDNTTSIEDAKLFQINMRSGTQTVTEVDGTVTITIPFDISSSLVASGISVFSVSANGNITPLETSYDAIHGSVSVTVDSFGTLGVSNSGVVDDGTGTSTLSYVALAVIIIVAVLCVFLCYRYLLM